MGFYVILPGQWFVFWDSHCIFNLFFLVFYEGLDIPHLKVKDYHYGICYQLFWMRDFVSIHVVVIYCNTVWTSNISDYLYLSIYIPFIIYNVFIDRNWVFYVYVKKRRFFWLECWILPTFLREWDAFAYATDIYLVLYNYSVV